MLISIIVPVYNTVNFIDKCITSLINQTYEAIEIILVDDGSTDGSGDKCDGYALLDDRIRVFHRANRGSSAARNFGLSVVRGDIIGFVDSDDYVDRDFIGQMAEALRDDLSMIAISRDEVDVNGARREDVCIPPERETYISAKEQIRELLMHRGDSSFCTRLCRRELFYPHKGEPRLFPEGELNEDFKLMLQILLSGDVDRFLILPSQAYHVVYRDNSNSRSGSKGHFSRAYTDMIRNGDYAYTHVTALFPDLEKEALRFGFFQRLDYMLHVPIGDMNRKNGFYMQLLRFLRGHLLQMLTNPYLKSKEKLYLLILSMAPKIARVVHRKIRGLP